MIAIVVIAFWIGVMFGIAGGLAWCVRKDID